MLQRVRRRDDGRVDPDCPTARTLVEIPDTYGTMGFDANGRRLAFSRYAGRSEAVVGVVDEDGGRDGVVHVGE